MLRRVIQPTSSFAALLGTQQQQVRHLRSSSIAETMKPVPGMSAGTLNVINEVCVNPEADEERKRPVFRSEVFPKREEHHQLATIWKWGYHSLTLFKKINEDPGPWWNANNSTLTSNWSQIGEYGSCGLWSGVWRYTYGLGFFNMRPGELRDRSFAKKERILSATNMKALTSPVQLNVNPTAVKIHYKEQLAQEKTDLLMFPHTKEHEQHKRTKNPALPASKTIDPVHGKRVLREVQYHLGQGMRFYMVDGVFGSHPAIATPFRVITDNANHAYLLTCAAIRNANIHAYEEVVLCKRLQQSPLDEWSWRRPGVLIYHAPCYDFELPRIVEEFGGPRPQDLSLTKPKFNVVDPYSIPMKSIIGGDPHFSTLLQNLSFLSARWGFYADDKGLLTLPGESIVQKDGTLALIVAAGGENSTVTSTENGASVVAALDILRKSNKLWGSFQHRLGGGVISRAYDLTGFSGAAPEGLLEFDYVEESSKTTYRPLCTAIGDATSHSHRFWDRRHVGEFGYKLPHVRSSQNTAQQAMSAGSLFGAGKKVDVPQPRPSAMALRTAKVVVAVEDKAKAGKMTAKDAAEEIIKSLTKRSWLYATPEDLLPILTKELEGAATIEGVAVENLATYAKDLVAANQ